MDEINQANQRIITLFPDKTTDGGQCWVAIVPSCLGLMAQGDTPAEALEMLAEFWRDYEDQYESFGEPLPPELYTLVERMHLAATG
jgi:predicted RNase H-like HicB family nuclease